MMTSQYITADLCILDAKQVLQDKSLTEGWYLSTVQRALTKLAFDNLWDKRHFTAPIVKNAEGAAMLTIDLPMTMFNLERAMVYNGDQCDVNTAQNLYWKRNWRRLGSTGFAENNWNNLNDPLMPSASGVNRMGGRDRMQSMGTMMSPPGNLYYFDVTDSQLFLSDTCAKFDRVFLEYTGIGVKKWGDVPFVPLLLREAVVDFVIMKGCEVQMKFDKNAATMYQIKYREVEGLDGSFAQARWALATNHTKIQDDLTVYLGKFGNGQ